MLSVGQEGGNSVLQSANYWTMAAYSQLLEGWSLVHLEVFSSRSMLQPGEELWRMSLGGDTMATPISFMLDGRQVIAVFAGQALIVLGL